LKKYLTSAAAIALIAGSAGMARADDSATVNGITFYGIIDVGVSYDTHGVPNSNVGSVGTYSLIQKQSNKATWGLAQSGMGQSRIGIKGAEDLGDGWTGLFRLETGINPDGGNVTDGLKSLVNNNGVPQGNQTAGADSSHAGQAFARAAYVGVSNEKYGTLTAGRQTTLQADLIGTYDPIYNSYAFSLIGFSGTAAGSGSTEDARWDNTIKYLYSYGPARIAAQYQFGGTITRNDTGAAFDLGFDYAGLSIDGVYVHKKDEVSASSLSSAQLAQVTAAGLDPSRTLTGTVFDTDSYSVGLRYTWDKFKFYGGYEYIKSMNPSSPVPTGVTSSVGYAVNIGGYYIWNPTETAFNNNREQQIAWIGTRYSATSKLEIDAAWYYLHQNSYATGANTGCNDTRASNCEGDENVFSVVADYHFSKKLDTYAGVMYSQALNGLANGFYHNNNIAPEIGLRYTF